MRSERTARGPEALSLKSNERTLWQYVVYVVAEKGGGEERRGKTTQRLGKTHYYIVLSPSIITPSAGALLVHHAVHALKTDTDLAWRQSRGPDGGRVVRRGSNDVRLEEVG